MEPVTKHDEPHSSLLTLARRYVWWKSPEEAVRDQRHLLAQVMTLGTVQDCVSLENILGRQTLVDALRNPPIGVFTGRAWHFWHHRLGLAQSEHDVPPLPQRVFSRSSAWTSSRSD